MCPAATGILEYYMYYLREKEKIQLYYFFIIFNFSFIGEEENYKQLKNHNTHCA